MIINMYNRSMTGSFDEVYYIYMGQQSIKLNILA